MRIRVQTIPPLPDLKAWFVPRPTSAILSVKTISDLKKVLCHDTKQLSQGGHSVKTIQLLLDGFELLDDLPYEEVLRDGDLIFIQVSQEALVKSEVLRKRKRRDTFDGVPIKKRKNMKNNNKSAISTNSDSSSAVGPASFSTTSESDDESKNSDSDSSTTSSNDSSSEFSDESADSSSTSSNSSRLLLEPIPVPAISPIPPGLGKSSTHSRNRRRRLRRQYEKEAKVAQSAPPQGISDTNLTPLGSTVSEKLSKGTKSGNGAESGTQTATELPKTQPPSSESRDTSCPLALDNSNGDVMMVSLRNKNKKKNFRQTMVAPAVRKIIFDDNGNAQSLDAITPVAATTSSVVFPLHAESTKTVQEDETPLSRVLPPSKLAAAGLLPSNMLVTSVEFGRQPKKKRKQFLRDTHEEEQVSHDLRVSKAYEDEDGSRFEDANIDLSYGDEEESGTNGNVREPRFDWGIAESNWERFSLVESLDQLRSGVLVCWQCLAINPQTFTPENMLSVGRVDKITTKTVTIRQLMRPGTEIAAAFGIGEEDGGDGAEEEHSSEDVFGLGWRVVELD